MEIEKVVCREGKVLMKATVQIDKQSNTYRISNAQSGSVSVEVNVVPNEKRVEQIYAIGETTYGQPKPEGECPSYNRTRRADDVAEEPKRIDEDDQTEDDEGASSVGKVGLFILFRH